MSFEYVENTREEAIDLLSTLCDQPSVSASGKGLRKMADLLKKVLIEVGFDAECIPTDGAPVVQAEVEGKGDATVVFYNHYDVQPPEPLDEWKTPPFETSIREGKIFARGAADNKGNIAARIWAVKTLLETEGELPVNVKFVVEGEEEIGSPNFERFVDEHREKVEGDGCIWEMGYKDENERLSIALGLKGICYVELHSKGPAHDLHSSLGTIVPNAAWKLVRALETLKNEGEKILIEGFYENVRDPTKEELQALERIPFNEEQMKQRFGISQFLNDLSGRALKKKHLYEPTCNICGLKSGWIKEGSKTVLPARAMAKIDFRLVPDQDPIEIRRKLRQHLDAHGFEDIEIKPAEGTKPARTSLNDPFVDLVVDAAREVYENDPVVYPTSAGSGPMYIIKELQIPVAGAGVGYADSKNHAPNENIRIKDYLQGIKHIIRILQKSSLNEI